MLYILAAWFVHHKADVCTVVYVLFPLQDNLALQVNKTKLKIDKTDVKFPESNLMHQINGYVYCNGPTLQLKKGQTVRWLVMGFGSEVDMHSPVFDGQAVQYAGVCVCVCGGGGGVNRKGWCKRF